MNNTLCERLNIRYPIIQAPMAGVSTPEMAAAVSNAGALGCISVGAGERDDKQNPEYDGEAVWRERVLSCARSA